MRSIIQRGYVRDYYDVWKLLAKSDHDEKSDYDIDKTKELFLKKCKAKGIDFTSIEQFFPQDIEKNLEPYVEVGLGRLLRDEDLPPIGKILTELRRSLEKIISA